MKLLLGLLLVISFSIASPAQEPAVKSLPAHTAEVYFDFGKHHLRPEADSVLSAILAMCQGGANCRVDITAHTDSIGSLANNEALSKKRAKTVADFFKAKGIKPDVIRTASFGETKPAAPNTDEAGRQLNRRATIEVFKSEPPGTVEGTVVNEKTGEPLRADVILHTKNTRDTLQTNEQGYFKKTFPVGTVVGIDAYAKCFFLKSDMAKAEMESKPVTLPLKPALAGATIDIDNLYFVGNQPTLLEQSKPELPKILRFLQMNPGMKIEIAGHVNVPNLPAVTKESWEYKLSVDRAKTVHDYLRENGIDAGRINYAGYGNWQMRYPNAVVESQQAQNRRVEIRIIEGECN